MNINFNKCEELYSLIQQQPEKLKILNQQERKVVQISLNVWQGKDLSQKSEITTNQMQNVINKLTSESSTLSPPPSSWYVRFGKAIMNLFHLRISAGDIMNDVKTIATAREEIKQYPELLAKKRTELAEWTEMLRFQEKDAAPVYTDIKKFYDNLPLDQASAKPKLQQKKTEVAEQLAQAKADRLDPGFIHILEKEILSSVTKMEKYQGKNFAREVHASRRVFTNALNFCFEQTVAKASIARLSDEISALEKREREILSKPFAINKN